MTHPTFCLHTSLLRQPRARPHTHLGFITLLLVTGGLNRRSEIFSGSQAWNSKNKVDQERKEKLRAQSEGQILRPANVHSMVCK